MSHNVKINVQKYKFKYLGLRMGTRHDDVRSKNEKSSNIGPIIYGFCSSDRY